MKDIERYNKTKEIVSKFKDGEKRYRESALFNQVVQMLVRDVDPYDVINQLIQVTEDTQEAQKQYMLRSTSPIL